MQLIVKIFFSHWSGAEVLVILVLVGCCFEWVWFLVGVLFVLGVGFLFFFFFICDVVVITGLY